MSDLPKEPTLREINALKKKLNWGDVPTIYHMALTAIGEIDGILTHGFDSPFKHILDRNTWNLSYLGGFRGPDGNILVTHKPQIILKHVFNKTHYELHCYPVMHNELVNYPVHNNPFCPFNSWIPETMQNLFRVNSLVAFITYSFQSGDRADIELVKYAYLGVERLIELLEESFDIVEIQGLTIAQFYRDINNQIQYNKGSV